MNEVLSIDKTTRIKQLKKKLNRYLKQESTLYFKIEKLNKQNLKPDPEMKSKARFFNTEITNLQNEIKELQEDMV